MSIKNKIQFFLHQQPELSGKSYLGYQILNILSIICLPLYFLLALLAVFILLLPWFKPVNIHPIVIVIFAIVILIYITKRGKNDNPKGKYRFPSINEFSNLIDSWAKQNGCEINTLILDEENFRISLSSNKLDPGEMIIVDYGTHQYDESLLIDYQNYRFWERSSGKIPSLIKFIPSVLDSLMLQKYAIIIEHCCNKLIDSKLKISFDKNEFIFYDHTNPLALAGSRFRKYLNVKQSIV